MIIPTLTYCSTKKIKISDYQTKKLEIIHKQAMDVINNTNDAVQNIALPSITHIRTRKTCELVRQCIDGNVCENFLNYFNVINKESVTRNGKYLLRLPKFNLEYGKSCFIFMGARTYNDLPLEIRKIENYKEFRDRLKAFMS